MFRSFLKLNPPKNLFTSLSNPYCTRNPGRIIIKNEINRATLVGTVFGNPNKYENGNKMLMVKTMTENGQNFEINVVRTNSPQDFKSGQRVYVSGHLGSKKIEISENNQNKHRYRTVVGARKIYILDESDKEGDQSSVELLATVCANVMNRDDHSVITAVTHYVSLEGEKMPDYHIIFVRDEGLRKYVRNNLMLSDRIFLNGLLARNSHVDLNGNKIHSGHIVAKQIHKIAKAERKETVDEDTSAAATN